MLCSGIYRINDHGFLERVVLNICLTGDIYAPGGAMPSIMPQIQFAPHVRAVQPCLPSSIPPFSLTPPGLLVDAAPTSAQEQLPLMACVSLGHSRQVLREQIILCAGLAAGEWLGRVLDAPNPAALRTLQDALAAHGNDFAAKLFTNHVAPDLIVPFVALSHLTGKTVSVS
jgi:hypothetical protein